MIQLQVLLYLLLKQAFAVDLDQSPPKPGLDELSVSIVNYLETVSFGPFECWFYRERWSKLPEDNSTIEHLLTLNSLSLVPKKVISSPFDVKHAAIEQSSLIFFEFRSNESVFSEESILWQWQPQTKLLIFATGQSCRDIPTGVHNQFKARLEVFYLFLDADLICRSLPLTREILVFKRSVPLAVLFEDRTLLSVYEVKITTLMTNRPRHADINTIEDLKRNGIKVLLPPMKLSAYEEKLIDLQFEHIDPSTQMENSLDGIHSYLFEEQSAVLYKFMCQEEDKERCMAYTSLSEKVKLLMRGNYIFNPTLMEPFSWIHQLLIESGIHNFSRENITSFVVGGLLKYRTLSDNAQVANMLNIADLKPAWISLGIGYAVGFSVAVFELAFHSDPKAAHTACTIFKQHFQRHGSPELNHLFCQCQHPTDDICVD
ncbi:conserved hypothetical protein [Culex quinquefasciatus]|uniref:Uncharacterized protein n=1 Tax=Culex quinquefasciatus TaxID=7176 RepID=B0XIK0_CULQU|nr:conserved hypothetical protein [Culex quinquefasciatus]|eukprot:XP_001869472.1 conserved hypothetical protein [Culex quinquefasciatus]